MRMHRCCFTDHRPQKLRRSEKEIKVDLETAIQQAITDGYYKLRQSKISVNLSLLSCWRSLFVRLKVYQMPE